MTTVVRHQRSGWRMLALAVCCLGVWTAHVMAAGDTLKIIPHADLKNTDPIWTTAYITRNHGYMIYDTLFSLDEQLQPQPQMVDTWRVSPDGLQYTLHIGSGPFKFVKEIAIELQRVAYEVVPYVNFGQWFLPTAYRKSLKGVLVSPVAFFWNISKAG